MVIIYLSVQGWVKKAGGVRFQSIDSPLFQITRDDPIIFAPLLHIYSIQPEYSISSRSVRSIFSVNLYISIIYHEPFAVPELEKEQNLRRAGAMEHQATGRSTREHFSWLKLLVSASPDSSGQTFLYIDYHKPHTDFDKFDIHQKYEKGRR